MYAYREGFLVAGNKKWSTSVIQLDELQTVRLGGPVCFHFFK